MEEEVKKEEAVEEKKTEEGQEEEERISAKSVLEELNNKPSKDEINKWKAQFGKVFVTAFGENEVFIYRPLDRKTWKRLNNKIAANQREIMEVVEQMRSQNTPQEQIEAVAIAKEIDQEELTVDMALLWSSVPKDELKNRAGIITSLANMIMEKSMFVPPQVAAVLTEEL